MPLRVSGEVIPKPKGQIVLRGNVTTGVGFAVVGDCTRTPASGKVFYIAKIALSCDEDAVAIITFGGTVISIEYKISAKIPVTDWFAWQEKKAVGDGSKALRIEGKYPSGGAAGDLHAELVGEEV